MPVSLRERLASFASRKRPNQARATSKTDFASSPVWQNLVTCSDRGQESPQMFAQVLPLAGVQPVYSRSLAGMEIEVSAQLSQPLGFGPRAEFQQIKTRLPSGVTETA